MASSSSNSTSCLGLNNGHTKAEKFSHPFNIVPTIMSNKSTRKHSFMAKKKRSLASISTKNYILRPNSSGIGSEKENNKALTKISSLSASVTNLNIKQLKTEANKTVQTFRTTIDSFSQKFRRTTRRRYRLEGGPALSPTNDLEGQSPVKLYSPFRIDTPPRLSTRMGTPGRYTPKRRLGDFSSPSHTFRRDVAAMNRGTRLLNDVAEGIIARSSFRE